MKNVFLFFNSNEKLLSYKKINIIFSALIFFSFLTNSFGQFDKVKLFTVNDGLSQNSIQAQYYDSQGYLWAGTEDGLNRYNGYEFKKFYSIRGDSNSLIYPDITTFLEPSFEKGVIWIGTRNGLSRYIKGKNRFENYNFGLCDTLQSGYNEIISLRESKYFKRTVWVTTRNGLVKFSADNNKYERMLTNCVDSRFASKLEVADVVERGKILWVVSSRGLIKYDLSDNSIKIFNRKNSSLDFEYLSSLFIDENEPDKFWIGTFSNIIYTFDAKTETFDKITFKLSNVGGYNPVAFIGRFDKYMIIGTNGAGLKWLDKEKMIFEEKPFNEQNYRLSAHICNNYVIDKSGILWVGTQGGLAKMNPLGKKFKKISKLHSENKKATEDDVWAFCEDNTSENCVWIGSDNGGILKFDYVKQEFQKVNNVFKKINYKRNIFSLESGKDGILWMGTFDGLVKVDLTNEKFNWIRKGEGNKFLSDSRILAIKNSKEKEDLLYIGTVNGFNILDVKSGDIKRICIVGEEGKTISASVVNCIFESERNPGTVWIGTENGLNKYSTSTGRIVKYYTQSKKNKFPGKFILSVAEDDSDPKYLWVAADNLGLVRFNTESEKLENIYSLREGLPNKTVYGILKDKSCLWMSTNNGLSKFNFQYESFKNFSVDDGLQGNEFNLGAYLKTSGGVIFFGGVDGFNFFHPDELNINQVTPNVVIEEVKVLNKSIDINSCSPERLEINLSYSDNMITFYFVGLEFTVPAQNKYQYKLTGFHSDWVDNGKERFATFTNLDPGEYVFKVRAANNDGIWSDNITEAKLIIEPALWMTWWFKGLVGVILFVNIFAFIYLKLQKPLEFERLRMKIARDLHDEVGSSLTKISMNAGLLRFDSDQERNSQRIETLDEESREVMTTMSDVIWSIDSRNNTIGDLTDRMKNHAFRLFENTDVDVSFSFNVSNPSKKIKIDVRQNIYLVFKEAINNAAKYSGSNEIEVKMDNAKSTGFILEIIDFGKGLPADMKHPGNGLRNMKARAESIGAKIEFINERGLTVRLTGNQI